MRRLPLIRIIILGVLEAALVAPAAHAVTVTVDFDNPAPAGSPDSLLNGVFGGIDFGTGRWRWSGPYAADSTNSIYFDANVTSRTFTFSPAPRRLESLRVYTSSSTGTLTLSDNLGQTLTRSVSPGAMQLVTSGWAQPSTVVTVSFTAGWNLGVDDIVHADAAPDTTPPTVSMTAPANGATVSGASVVVSAAASDNAAVAGVQFLLDGANLGAEDLSAPYGITWNTTTAANGPHSLSARARDTAGNTALATGVTVTVSNTLDTTPPTVSISSPAPGASVSGIITVSANASDNVGVAGVQFRLDGANLGAEDTAGPYAVSWDTRGVPNGSHALGAMARDAAGNVGNASPVSVTVANSAAAAGSALRFYGNGVDAPDLDRVKIRLDDPATSLPGPPADVGAEDFTVELWMRATAAENPAAAVGCGANNSWIYGNIIVDRDRYNQDRSYGLSIAGGRLVFGVDGNGTGTRTICATTDVLNNAWHHVAVQRRRSDGQMSLYVDGRLEAQADGPDGDISYPDNGVPGNFCGGPCTNSDPFLVLGAEKHDAGAQYPSYSGWMDELRLSRSLRYGADFTPPSAPFVTDATTAALYHFDEGSGDTVADVSGAAGGPSHGVRRFGGSPAGPVWVASDAPIGPDTSPPARSSGSPSGTLPYGTSSTTLSLQTNENATCRYGTTPGTSYALLPNAFATSGGTSHSTAVGGLANGGSYAYVVRCQDAAGNANPDDFTISFSVASSAGTPGLVAAYGFNEASGATVADGSGNANTGTISGATRTTQGRFGGALAFDGVNDWVTVNDANSLDLTTGLTLEAWVYPTVTPTGWRTVIAKEMPGDVAYFLHANSSANLPATGVTIGGVESQLSGGSRLTANVWTHLAATYDGATQRLYVNGAQVASRAQTGAAAVSANPLRIGGNGLWGEYFQGRIDEVRIYNRALTPAEIQQDLNTAVGP